MAVLRAFAMFAAVAASATALAQPSEPAPRNNAIVYKCVNADGSVADAWLLDAVPDADLGLTLRKYAREMRAPPAHAGVGKALRYAWMPVIYDDGRYRARPMH